MGIKVAFQPYHIKEPFTLRPFPFDIFDEYLDDAEVVVVRDLPPGGRTGGDWVVKPLEPHTFYTGVAYVWKVRFLNGDIWEASQEDVYTQLRQIEDGFEQTSRTKRGG